MHHPVDGQYFENEQVVLISVSFGMFAVIHKYINLENFNF